MVPSEHLFRERIQELLSPWFLLSLGLLILNDHVLKAEFGNPLTGKLSDFAGIFAFTWVGLLLVPKLRRSVMIGIALTFTLWKLPVSTPWVE